MTNIKIYCSTIKHYKVLDKLPSYITPIGLGDGTFPDNWKIEKNGKNISHLNKYYAQLTMYYWIWKNKVEKLHSDDFIGFCEHRLLWLNELYQEKQKFSINNLYNKLLQPENDIFKSYEIIVNQPVVFSNKSLFEDFEQVHEKNILDDVINFLPTELQKPFKDHLKGNTLHLGCIFITKKKYFEEYCELIFPWVDKCYKYCNEKNLCKDYNIRLPVFLAERFSSFWMSKFKNKKTLSLARLGNFHLSNKLNFFVNSTKLPFTFYQYPTLYNY